MRSPGGAARLILEAADTARRELAHDIHDGAQQKFVTAVINLQLAQAKFDSDPSRSKRYLDAAFSQAEAGLSELRDLVAGIHPPVLTHLGLKAAVEVLAEGFPMRVDLALTDRRFPLPIEESLYFFVSECLTNVLKHAHASTAAIQIAAGEADLTVEVSDDGVGGAAIGAGGSGLPGLLGRVQALRGDLTLASPPTGGTVLRGVIPLPAD
jgi:signal transduction histidine kinase